MEVPSERPAANVSAACLLWPAEVVRPGRAVGACVRACAPRLCSALVCLGNGGRGGFPPACKPRRRQRQRPSLRRGKTLLFLAATSSPRPSRGIGGFSKIGPGHRVAPPSNPLPGAPGVERTQIVGGPFPPFALPRFSHSGEGAKRPLAAGPGHPSPLPPAPERAALPDPQHQEEGSRCSPPDQTAAVGGGGEERAEPVGRLSGGAPAERHSCAGSGDSRSLQPLGQNFLAPLPRSRTPSPAKLVLP